MFTPMLMPLLVASLALAGVVFIQFDALHSWNSRLASVAVNAQHIAGFAFRSPLGEP